ncbi:MAG: hypothetical protein IKM04_03810 [Clostridia bacterium]|nr:hypothetical protein [Clostridia bacterium]
MKIIGKKWVLVSLAIILALTLIMIFEGEGKSERTPSPYDGSIDYAARMANGVSWEIGYRGETEKRESLSIRNLGATLVSTLRGTAGVELSFGENTVSGFNLCAEIEGKEYRDDVITSYARTNVYRHGLYYADIHVMVLSLAADGGDSTLTADVERVYHTYGDKIVENVTLRNAEADIDRLWIELKTEGRLITGENYAAVVLPSGGTVGYILPYGVEGELETEINGNAVTIRLAAEPKGAERVEFTFGARLFYGSEEELEAQAGIEADPIYPDNYVGLCGYYGVGLPGSDFNHSYYNAPNYCPEVSFSLPAEERGRTLYVLAHTDSGGLEASAVTDGEGTLLPIAVQTCKNFGGENEEPLYNPSDATYGQSVIPLMTGKEELSYRVYHIYQQWGNYPIKQLSSIQFFMPYYHLSVGVTETTCFAMNYYLPEGDGYFVPDLRGLSGEMWADQPQFDSAGRVFLTHYLKSGSRRTSFMRYTHSDIASVGTAYTDVTMYFTSQDGSSRLSYRAVELPQTDENRNYTTLRLEFLKDTSVEDLRFMSFHGRTGNYSGVDYLATDGSVKTAAVDYAAPTERFLLGKDRPFIAAYGVDGDSPTASVAMILRGVEAVIGGKRTETQLALAIGEGGHVWLTAEPERIDFKAGDYIELDFILLPYGSSTETSKIVQAVREDLGDMIFDGVAKDGRAEISVGKGINNVVIRASGFASYVLPKISIDGEEIVLSSGNGRADGYQVVLDDDGLYTFAFTIDSALVNGKRVILEQN